MGVDSSELGRNFQPTVRVVGDVKLFLQDLLTHIKGRVKRLPLRMMPRVKEVVGATAAYIAEVKMSVVTRRNLSKLSELSTRHAGFSDQKRCW